MPWHSRAKVAARLEQEIRQLEDAATQAHRRIARILEVEAKVRVLDPSPESIVLQARLILAGLGPDVSGPTRLQTLVSEASPNRSRKRCDSGLHLWTPANQVLISGMPRCRICRVLTQRARRAVA